jgi:hypothetical protein
VTNNIKLIFYKKEDKPPLKALLFQRLFWNTHHQTYTSFLLWRHGPYNAQNCRCCLHAQLIQSVDTLLSVSQYCLLNFEILSFLMLPGTLGTFIFSSLLIQIFLYDRLLLQGDNTIVDRIRLLFFYCILRICIYCQHQNLKPQNFSLVTWLVLNHILTIKLKMVCM